MVSHTHIHSLTHTQSHSHTPSHTHTPTLPHTLTHTHTHTHPNIPSHSPTLSPSYTLTHTHLHTLSSTHTLTHSYTLAHLSHLHTQLPPAQPLPFICLWHSPPSHIFIPHRSCNIQQPHSAVKPPLSTRPSPENLLQHLPPVGLRLLRFLRTYKTAAQISVSRSSADI